MYTIFLRLCAVFLMIGMGWLARRTGLLDGEATRRLARLQTQILYPALIFTAIAGSFTLSSLGANWALPAGAFAIMLVGFLTGLLIRPFLALKEPAAARGFLFQCTINNYSYLPMPLALFFWGETGVAALMFSTLGSEAAVWTLGVCAMTGDRLSGASLRRLLNVPLLAIVASVATLAVRAAAQAWWPQFSPPGALRQLAETGFSALEFMGRATIPLAMITVGSRMSELRPAGLVNRLQAAIALLRLIVIPGLAILLLSLAPLPATTRAVLILVAVMPSANASVVLSELYGGDVRLAAGAILVTHAFCLVTVPLWLHHFAGV
ncbi:MAG: Membrane transport protein [Lentisphaerae bacterium ADurb.BinA184]|nr:MAG: Membrane transport protein [Lentisphaerae bacterium ADurb.BinA184]